MVEVSTTNISDSLKAKLAIKNIDEISNNSAAAFNFILAGSNLIIESKNEVNPIILLSSAIQKVESFKKFKPNRSPKVIVLCNSGEKADEIKSELETLKTKEIIIISCNSKKSKKALAKGCDIVVGTKEKVVEMIKSEVLCVKRLKQIYVFESENINDLGEFFELTINENTDNSLNESTENKTPQLVVQCDSLTDDISTFLKKYEPETLESEDSSSQSSDGSKSDEEKDESDKKDDDDSDDKDESEDESDNGTSPVKEQEKVNGKIKEDIEIDAVLLKSIKNANNYEQYNGMSKKLLNDYSDVEIVSRFLSVLLKDCIKSKPSFKTGSKYTGREGYTAYHFRTVNEAFSSGYLFKGLKRLIDEEIVEKIERVMMERDKKGFVFDLPSEHDSTFQDSWSDGKFDTLELLGDSIPSLIQNDRQSGNQNSYNRNDGRGGFRGGSRGSFRGDRGGRGGRGGERGGRGGQRGGYKRGNDSFNHGSNSKVQRLD